MAYLVVKVHQHWNTDKYSSSWIIEYVEEETPAHHPPVVFCYEATKLSHSPCRLAGRRMMYKKWEYLDTKWLIAVRVTQTGSLFR